MGTSEFRSGRVREAAEELRRKLVCLEGRKGEDRGKSGIKGKETMKGEMKVKRMKRIGKEEERRIG